MQIATENITINELRAKAADRPYRLARLRARPLPNRLLPPPPRKIEIVDHDVGDTGVEVSACRNDIVLVGGAGPESAAAIFIGLNDQRLKIANVQRAVAKYFGVTFYDLISARRTVDIVRPRQIGYYLAQKLTLRSLPEIGRRFGGRDHTSVLSGIRKIERLRSCDPTLEADLQAIAASVGGSLEEARVS